MSFNFAEYVASIIGLNMTDVRFASLTKEFIILCRHLVPSEILFKYRKFLEIIFISYLYNQAKQISLSWQNILVLLIFFKYPNYSMKNKP